MLHLSTPVIISSTTPLATRFNLLLSWPTLTSGNLFRQSASPSPVAGTPSSELPVAGTPSLRAACRTCVPPGRLADGSGPKIGAACRPDVLDGPVRRYAGHVTKQDERRACAEEGRVPLRWLAGPGYTCSGVDTRRGKKDEGGEEGRDYAKIATEQGWEVHATS